MRRTCGNCHSHSCSVCANLSTLSTPHHTQNTHTHWHQHTLTDHHSEALPPCPHAMQAQPSCSQQEQEVVTDSTTENETTERHGLLAGAARQSSCLFAAANQQACCCCPALQLVPMCSSRRAHSPELPPALTAVASANSTPRGLQQRPSTLSETTAAERGIHKLAVVLGVQPDDTAASTPAQHSTTQHKSTPCVKTLCEKQRK